MNELIIFFNQYGEEVITLLIQHIGLTGAAVATAICLAVPVGIFATRSKKLSTPLLGFASIIQTIPSLALFGLMIPILMNLKLPMIGFFPAYLALFLYALLPILRNTYTGIKQVDPSIIEAAVGIGMTDKQILCRIELPMAVPIIMAGIRTSTVISVGIATLATFIGAGGLGDLIWKGIETVNYKLMLGGAIPAAILALCLDFILGTLEKVFTPNGLKLLSK